MAQPVIQTAFHAGEFAPNLYARVDLAKYHSGVSLAENWYVDYRGGMSTRMGTKYVLRGYKDATQIRLIPFQAATDVGFVLEFGDLYIRFYFDGAPVLEDALSLTSASNANPAVFGLVFHGLQDGDWVFASDFTGGTWPTKMNQKYFIVAGATTNDFTLTDLFGNPVSGVGLGTWTAGDVRRVYTLASPYTAAQVGLIKYAQNVSDMVLCHPDQPPYILRLIEADNWSLTPISFGATVTAPTNVAASTTLGSDDVHYSYVVTAVDATGQESAASTAAILADKEDLRTVPGTNRISWDPVSGAIRYNVYKAEISYDNPVPAGAVHGFIGDTTGVEFDDSNIAPDFSLTPPIPQNPFVGSGVASVTVAVPGTYTSVPMVTFSAPSSGQTATGTAVLRAVGTGVFVASGSPWAVGEVGFSGGSDDGIPVGNLNAVVATINGGNQVTSVQPWDFPGGGRGAITSGPTPGNPVRFDKDPATGNFFQINVTWGVLDIVITSPGSGYTAAPIITFDSGAAVATAVLAPNTSGNPTVPQFAYQRLWLMGPTGNPQGFNASKVGQYTNYDISIPTQPDDAISGTIVSGILNEIKAAIPMPSGLILLASGAAWQIYGEQPGQAPTAVNVTAQSQAYNGANDVPPIVANFDILYVQAKGSSVRNLAYNFYTNIYTGTDISVLSSHLFYNHTITEWCWAEEPFKTAWAVREDGILLTLTFLKEQELIGWTHSNTQGLFKSVASVQEEIEGSRVDAVYMVVERDIDGTTVQYIERMAERNFTNYIDPWCVDSGLRYEGAPEDTFGGAEHLAGMDIVGLADGIPFEATVDSDGVFELDEPASFVTAGLSYVPKFRTLRIETGNPTIQGKMKLLNEVTVRVAQTLGLKIGKTEATAKTYKDLVLGNVSTMQNARVTDLVTGDAKQAIDPQWDTLGEIYIEQPLPYPATLLGYIPELSIGDTAK